MQNPPQLAQQLYALLEPEPQQGIILGFTSALAGEGVSYVTRKFALELAQCSDKQIGLASLPLLEQAGAQGVFKQHTFNPPLDNLWELAVPAGIPPQPTWEGNPLMRQTALDYLRHNFDVVMLDCPALASADVMLKLALRLDGIILVVESGRTSREAVLAAQRALQSAEAKLLGIAPNDRLNPEPIWLNRLF
jgi:Mrp family chromosome partitioning ATPase